MHKGSTQAAFVVALFLFLAVPSSVRADSALFVEFGGDPIPGGDDPDFLPNVRALFFVDETAKRMTIQLTYDPSGPGQKQLAHNSQVLTGLVFSIENSGLTLTPDKALIPSGSALVFDDGSTDPTTDVSSEWAFRSGPLNTGAPGTFDFGVSSVGTLQPSNSFGPKDRFDTSTNLYGPLSPNGTQVGLVNSNALLTKDGLPNNDPFIQDSVVLTFTYTESAALPFTAFQITKVQPFFGSDGIVLNSEPDVFNAVPEPSSIAMTGLGVLGLLVYGWRRRARRALCVGRRSGP